MKKFANITNMYGLPVLTRSIPLNSNHGYILLHGKKLDIPICTDMEDVHEFHYILKEWNEVYKIPYGERRYPAGIFTGYLELFTPNTKIDPSNLPEDAKKILREHILKEIKTHYMEIAKYKKLIKRLN